MENRSYYDNDRDRNKRNSSRTQTRSRSQSSSRTQEQRRMQSSGRAQTRSRVQGSRRRRKNGFRPGILLLILAVLVAATAAILVIVSKKETPEPEKPRLEAPAIVSTATIGSTGDILIHSPIFESAAIGDGNYDFGRDFALVAPYYQAPDLMVANLEVTCAGPEKEYRSYPLFNCPDNIVTTLAASGVDVCLTANNHMNDSGEEGLFRTMDVIQNNGMDYMGTRRSPEDHYIITKMVNGIKLGMVCYTYDTREITGGWKSLNGLPLSDNAADLVNTFNYEDLESFYAQVQSDLDQMRMLGVEANIFYVHWGNEYMDEPNEYQTEMAARMCELGVDVIVGGHPHVIERYDTLVSSTGHETLCLYSMGNEISNQRANLMEEDGNRGYTEDGLIFHVSFSKFNNGRVKVTGLDIIPTWVDLTNDGAGTVYRIIPLDHERDPGSWGASSAEAARNSYNRTMGRLSPAYNMYREKIRLAPDPDTL